MNAENLPAKPVNYAAAKAHLEGLIAHPSLAKKRKNEVLFMEPSGAVFAALSRRGLFVSARRVESGVRFSYISRLDEVKLGLGSLKYSEAAWLGKELAWALWPN